jgi:DNA replication protein DnaC
MTTPLKAELKESLKKLWLSEFAAQHSTQSALAASEGWTYDQYLLRLCELELQQRELRKRQKLLTASRLPREKTLENFERHRLKRNVERQFGALLNGEFLKRAENVLVFGSPGGGKTHRHNYYPKSRR